MKPLPKQSSPVITTEILTITPEIAKQFLDANISNRVVNQARVERYARHMENGEWVFNGESIIVDEDGTLANGQHRLLACLRSGKSFTSIVVTGVPKESFATIDSGSTRKASDVLSIAGYRNTSTLSAACRTFAWGLDNRDLRKFCSSDALEIANEYEPICRWASAYASHKPNVMGAGVAGACALIEIFHGFEPAASFFNKAVLGQMLQPKDPEYALRQIIINTKTGRVLSTPYKMALTIKTANFSVQKRQVSQLKILDSEKVIFWRGK